MEGAYINIKLIIGNRELVPCSSLSKREGYFKIVDREQGIGKRELVPWSLFWYIILKFQSANQE